MSKILSTIKLMFFILEVESFCGKKNIRGRKIQLIRKPREHFWTILKVMNIFIFF